MQITFLGAAHEVTGSKHLIELPNGKKALIDCGLFQGRREETDVANRNPGINPADIDYILLSHAHIDHSGLIPYFVRNGFKGLIFSTPATRELCVIMLLDSGRIHENDAKSENKRRAVDGLPPIEPLYDHMDAENSMQYFVSIPYNLDFNVDENLSIRFTDVGHILGSAAINLKIKEDKEVKSICFTGDIGRPYNRILRSPQPLPSADYLITESTYGDRLHENIENADEQLWLVVHNTCVKKKGKLIIPSFSVGRTQEILYALNLLSNAKRLPPIKVYLDSPLSVNATNIMRFHPECFNAEVLESLRDDPDPFGFNGLYYIQSVEDSKKLNNSKEPCIIISASGMMDAGRVKHHLANSISNKRNTVLVVGYCAPYTLGAHIRRGDPEVTIYGTTYQVNADIEIIDSFSAHGDYIEMISYLNKFDKEKLKKVFIVHGEFETQKVYREKMLLEGFKNIEIPAKNETFVL